MNNAKMWLVVSPSVGVPVFLGAVAVGSFSVHVAVLSNTGWVSDFLSGNELGSSQSASLKLDAPETAKAAYVLPSHDGAKEVTLILDDGTAVRAVLQPNDVLASANIAPPLVAD